MGFADRLSARIIELGYITADGKPHLNEWCREKQGYTRQVMDGWISGSEPYASTLYRLAMDLAVSPEWLLFGKVETMREPRGRKKRSHQAG